MTRLAMNRFFAGDREPPFHLRRQLAYLMSTAVRRWAVIGGDRRRSEPDRYAGHDRLGELAVVADLRLVIHKQRGVFRQVAAHADSQNR